MDSKFQAGELQFQINDDMGMVGFYLRCENVTRDYTLNHADARTLAHLLLRAVGDYVAPSSLSDAEVEMIAKERIRAGDPVTMGGRLMRDKTDEWEERQDRQRQAGRESVTPETLEAARRLVEDPGQTAPSGMYVGGQFIGAPIPSEMMEISDVLSDDAYMDECAAGGALQVAASRFDDPFGHADAVSAMAYDLAEEMLAERKRRRKLLPFEKEPK